MIEDLTIINALKVFLPAAVAFFIGMGFAPILASILYRNEMWKKKSSKITLDGRDTPVFTKLHGGREVGTPRMGGVLIWSSALVTLAIMYLLSLINANEITEKLNFLSRGQTWLTTATLIGGAVVGFIDDWYEVKGGGSNQAGGLSLLKRLGLVALMGIVSAWWFYTKLGVSSIHIPFDGQLELGVLMIPFFAIVMIALYSGGVIDGIDGLAGGVFATVFGAYGIIAFAQSQINLAAFCFVIVGGLLAFLWYNIPPARFYMSETGSMALTVTLAVVAFLTQQVLLLAIIAFPLLATSISNIIQLFGRIVLKRKIFQIAPIHHHFEAIGWPAYKVTMRYWIISVVFALIGVSIALVG